MSVSHTTSGSLRAEAAALIRSALAGLLVDAQRPIRLRLAASREPRAVPLDGLLLVQRIEIHEAVFEGLEAHVTCLSANAELPLAALLGVPVEIQFVTDRGRLRRFCALVTEARAGQSDGGLAVFQLSCRDALGVMAQRLNSRVFRQKSALDISHILLREWLQLSPGLARAFDFDLSRLSPERYPQREFTMQHNESDAAFLRRSWKRVGIGWVIQPGPPDETPRHTLILFDDARRLAANAAGELRYHRDAATEQRDAITQWSPARRLVPGRSLRQSWDYRAARMLPAEEASILDQGASGNALARALQDSAIEMPHAGNDLADHARLTRLRMLRHEFEGHCVHGLSGVRDLAAGEWNSVTGHPTLDRLPSEQREYLMVDVQHWGENNLPKQLDERAQSLLAGSAALPGWRSAAPGQDERRYLNRFSAVRRDVPLVPAWKPHEDLPPTPPLTAIVVGPQNEAVHCDALGRVKVQFQGLNPEDHQHAQGAGTDGSERDSAWLRVNFGWAGAGFGSIQPLRVGMEVVVQFLGGDPDRPLITGALYNGRQAPPRFSQVGSLPGNRYLSGTTTREIDGRRANQLRFDDTPGQISAQLASEHGQSQLNLGYLTHPRQGGAGEARGEGFELRSDESGAIRTAKGLLLSAWQRLEAHQTQWSADEHRALMDDCLQLFQSLGQYAAAHRGVALDEAPQQQLKADGQSPSASLTAPAGVMLTTPKTLQSYAGQNIDSVARQHLQLVSGGRCAVNAGEGVSLFAHQGGVSAVAHRGQLVLQSQHDDTRIEAAKNIQLSAAGGRLAGLAQDEIVFITAGGAYLKLSGGDVEIGGPGALRIRTAGQRWEGPAGMAAQFPRFTESKLEPICVECLLHAAASGAPVSRR